MGSWEKLKKWEAKLTSGHCIDRVQKNLTDKKFAEYKGHGLLTDITRRSSLTISSLKQQ